MLRRSISLVFATLVLLSVSAVVVAQTRKPVPVSSDTTTLVRRHAETQTEPWTSQCGSDYCSGAIFGEVSIKTPSDPGTYSALITTTLQYRTSKGAPGSVGASIGTQPPYVPISPGGFMLAPGGLRPATLTWVADDLLPDTTYVIRVSAMANGGKMGEKATLTGVRSVTVVDITG